MTDTVDVYFNYGGEWVISPEILYNKRLVHMWNRFDPDMLSYKDLCEEFTKELGFTEVKQLLVVGPSGRFYIIDGDDGIKALQCLVIGSIYRFKIINLFVVDELDSTVHTQSILHHTETFLVDVEAVSKNEHVTGDYDFDVDAPSDVEYDFEGLEVISKQRRRVVSDRLENFKELDKGMTFKDIVEARKGLLDDVSIVLPDTHHMYCARHIEANWLKKWRSGEMRRLIWWCGWSTYKEEFKDQLLKLGGMSEDAARDLINYPPKACETFVETEVGTQQSQQSVFNTQAGTQEFSSYGPDVGDDEDPTIRSTVISEIDTRLAMRKVQMNPTGTRRIQFTGDETGAATPMNLPYSPTKATWNGKPAITSS
ncbi:hypothetical protein A4A49_14083 [Nicotiana attenuata]|uniref:Uncharacterized protein n=1 Tax=Nicotiana attenuata TaxID=49451 RepID=A0A1J6IXW0_NICAT|nr:hypothetical protein A4A49_14083 [Nicotiana attenuata]